MSDAPRDQTEDQFLETYDVTAFERPSVAVDVVILGAFDKALHAIVVKRVEHPDRGKWALPGGFVRMDESLDAAATRVLATKAGLDRVFLEQLYTFGDPGRDPRTRVIAVGYYALVDEARFRAIDTSDKHVAAARIDVPWGGETGGPVTCRAASAASTEELPLAFDHEDILGLAVRRVRGKINYAPIGFQLLPDQFTLRALQDVHETVLGLEVNKDSFRRRMLASGTLEATGERQRDVGHRPAELYRFVRRSAV